NGTDKVLAVGEEARRMLGRTPGDVSIVRPIQNGVISRYTTTKSMLEYFMDKAIRNPLKRLVKPDVIICIPSKTTGVEKRAVEKTARDAGAGRIFLVEEPLAAAVGAGIDISKPSGNLIVDVGGGTTDIAVISYEGIVSSRSVKVAGDTFDEVIKNYIKKKYSMLIGDRTAEFVKIEAGCMYRNSRKDSVEIQGSDIQSGLPREVMITSDELVEPLVEAALPILDAVKEVLEETPPELAADIFSRGIIMTGGGSLVGGFDELLRTGLGIDATVADDAQTCVVNGSLKILRSMSDAQKNALSRA
ncbi:MAG: rod shape-determining protein, partial [Clostridia bacterium]|nr:rod shape-determining protein [Clostridia bacterium]